MTVLVTSFSLLLWNCEKNEITETSTKSIVTHISFKEFIQTTGIKENSSLLKVSKNTKEKLTLLKEDIIKIDRENYSSYTFKVLTNTPNSHFFYNYVVLINTQGIILSSNLFEYQPSKKWLLNTQKPFTGKVKLITGVDSNLLSRGGLCVTGVRSFWLCSFNNTGPQHAPGQCNASSTEYIVEYEIGPCSAEGDGNGAAEVSDSSSGPGGGGSSGGGSIIPVDTSISLPTIPPDENGKCPDGYIKDLTTNECIKIEEEDDKIINNLTGKEKCIYDKLKSLNLFKSTIQKFENSESYNLTISLGNDCGSPSDDGCTDGSDINNGNVKITLQISASGQPLNFASALLHEGIHAELFKYVNENQKGIDPNNRQKLLYW